MTRKIDPADFNPWKEISEQTPEAKLVLVRAAARGLVATVKRLCLQPENQSSRERAVIYLVNLEKEGILELINEE